MREANDEDVDVEDGGHDEERMEVLALVLHDVLVDSVVLRLLGVDPVDTHLPRRLLGQSLP